MWTFRYYTNLRLQIVSFWYVIYPVIMLGHRGEFHRPLADFSQTLASLSNDDGGANVSEKVNSRCFEIHCSLCRATYQTLLNLSDVKC